MNETRKHIADHIDDNPGVHFKGVIDQLDIASGQVQHHVYRLIRDDEVVEESLYGRSHYFPPSYDEWERGALALLRRETARGVLVELLETDGRAPADLADAVGVARSTLEWHLDHLVEQSVVEKRRDDAGRVTVHLTDPEDTALLLAEVTPSYSDRFVDRFMRLVDQLLEDAA